MGWRFRKQIKIAPGFKLNVSKSGTSLSIGERGATLNVGRHGETITTGIPGTGLSYRKRIGKIRPVHRHSLLSLLLGLGVVWFIFCHH
jgi:hypothetical protein